MTAEQAGAGVERIIPYQELLGNYDGRMARRRMFSIIPYQELLGNYDWLPRQARQSMIIPYQELLGNYDAHYDRLGRP